MSRCFGYGRASTDKQEVTEQVQREAAEAYYRTHLKPRGVVWAGWFYDAAISGSTQFSEREEGLKVWLLAQPGDHVVALKADRMFRNTIDGLTTMEAFDRKGVTCQPLDMPSRKAGARSADAEFFDTVHVALGQRERRVIGERTSAAMRRLAANGVRFGRAKSSAPIGWMRHGDGLVPDPEERGRVEQMAQWRVDGLSFERIAMRATLPPYCWARRYAAGRKGRPTTGWDRRYVRLALTARDRGYPRAFLNSRSRQRAAGQTPEAVGP
jgi:DNA invertase Pin-like site-specific DNA recombinase